MHILVAGVRQKNAPIEVREKFALTEEEVDRAIPYLLGLPGILECAILTTCNRTEIYATVSETEAGFEAIQRFFREFKGFELQAYRSNIFTLLNEDAAVHLFRVASGLDSLILGEGQILGQVKDTLSVAQRLKSTGVVMDRLFKTALSIGKRVRTETGIAHKDVSVSRAAFEFAKAQDPDLLDRRIALVGGGKMAEIMMASLKREMTPAQQENVTLINRSRNRLETLCGKFGFRGVSWDQLDPVLTAAEVLFVATGAPHIVFDAEDFSGRGSKLIIDISVPRNVSPEVGDLPEIRLFNTDNLGDVPGFSRQTQEFLIEHAETIIGEEYAGFAQWFVSLPVVPTLTRLRSKVERIRKAEAACACPVTGTSCSVIDNLSKNLVNKILHDPTVRLKSTRNLEEIYQQAAMLSHLFDIDAAPAPQSVSANG